MQKRIEGYVDFAYTVDKMGFVRDPEILESTSKVFNKAATDALLSFRYAPQFEDGEPVVTEDARIRLTFAFAD